MTQKLRILAIAVVILAAYWNVVRFSYGVERNYVPRDLNEIVLIEKRLAPVRAYLSNYPPGEINYLSNRDLQAQKRTGDDDNRWMRTTYVLLPWKVRRNEPARFALVDFGSETPAPVPEDFKKLYDSGDGLVLFEKTQLP